MASFTVDTQHQRNMFVSNGSNDTYSRAQFIVTKDEGKREFTIKFGGASTYSKYDWGFPVLYDVYITDSTSPSTKASGTVKYNAPYSGGNWAYIGWWATTEIEVGGRNNSNETNHIGKAPRFVTSNGANSGQTQLLDGSGYKILSPTPPVNFSKTFKFDENGNPKKAYVQIVARTSGKIPDEDTGKITNDYYVSSGYVDVTKYVGTIAPNKIDVKAYESKESYPEIGATKNLIAWRATASANSDEWAYKIDNAAYVVYSKSGATSSGAWMVSENAVHTLKIRARRAGTSITGESNTLTYDLRKPPINNPLLVVNGSASGNLSFNTVGYKVEVFFGRQGGAYNSLGVLGDNELSKKFEFSKNNVALESNYKGSYVLRLVRTNCRSIINEYVFNNVDTVPAKIELKVRENYPIATTVILDGKSDKEMREWKYTLSEKGGRTLVDNSPIYPNDPSETYRINASVLYKNLEPGKRYVATFSGYSRSNIKSVSNEVEFTARGGVNIYDSSQPGANKYRIAGVYIFNSNNNKWEVYNPYVFNKGTNRWEGTKPNKDKMA